MKKVLLGSLLAGGLLFAANDDEVTKQVSSDENTRISSSETAISTTETARLSNNERIALESQSPRVHPARMHKHQKASRRMDQVVSDKQTVNAFIPYGK